MKQAVLAIAASVTLMTLPSKAAVKTQDWGKTPAGQSVQLFTLEDGKLRVQLAEYGARIISIDAPDRQGKMADVVLGFNSLQPYATNPQDYFGPIVGRFANRIAKGTFTLDGKTYHVPLNNNGNALHGGPGGFSTKVWKGRVVGDNKVEFTLVSPDGDMGFPGELTVHVTYTLLGDRLRIDYAAKTTAPTIVNLTNHTFFNLGGQGSDILGQQLRIDADRYSPVDSLLIPQGPPAPVQGTPFDFRKLSTIGPHIQAGGQQLGYGGGGFDHNFVLNGKMGELHEALYNVDPKSGRTLTVLTTEPGLQIYSGNSFNGTITGSAGVTYPRYGGYVLETQHFPDSPNRPDFPSTVLRPGGELHSSTVYVFGVMKN